MRLQAHTSAEGVEVLYKIIIWKNPGLLFGRVQTPRPFESKDALDSGSSTLERLTTTLSSLCFPVFLFSF